MYLTTNLQWNNYWDLKVVDTKQVTEEARLWASQSISVTAIPLFPLPHWMVVWIIAWRNDSFAKNVKKLEVQPLGRPKWLGLQGVCVENLIRGNRSFIYSFIQEACRYLLSCFWVFANLWADTQVCSCGLWNYWEGPGCYWIWKRMLYIKG